MSKSNSVQTGAEMENINSCSPENNAVGDDLLAAAAANGSEAAVEQLYYRYRRPLYSYLNRMLNHDNMTADDMFQELWIKVIKNLCNYSPDGKFGAWIFRIARNQVLEHFRREKSRAKLGTTTEDGELPDISKINTEPSGMVGAQELTEKLQQLLSELPPEQREVFIMRQNNLSFKEIAEIQKCPINTALGRMHNCLKFLRHKLCQ
ncbi:MAG: sigma-70 family RNA polymerase sigma factor [Lentisphaerae bacterium]|nr:sigma-70 family RNA polymerase sigma factor [Lentisphaerota bacterium]